MIRASSEEGATVKAGFISPVLGALPPSGKEKTFGIRWRDVVRPRAIARVGPCRGARLELLFVARPSGRSMRAHIPRHDPRGHDLERVGASHSPGLTT